MPKAKVKIDNNEKDKHEEFLYKSLKFAFVSSPKNGRKQCFPFNTCRDYLHEFVRAEVHRNNESLGMSGYSTIGKGRIELCQPIPSA